MGLADVLVDPTFWVAVYGLSRTVRVWQSTGDERWAVIWVAVCAVAYLTRPRGLLLLSATAFGLGATLVHHNGFILAGWLALIFGAFLTDESRRWLVRVLTSTVYGFAAANKMFALSGSTLAAAAPWLPFPRLFAPAVVVLQAVLAWAVWRRRWWAVGLALLLHVPIVLGVRGATSTWFGLLGYNGALVAMTWYATSRSRTA